jgi:4-hydroxy-2-oxoheptanedioate aldolase
LSHSPTGKASLKARIHAREPLNGCFIQIPSAALVEMVACAGFDFAILDQEHGPADSIALENQIRAAEAGGMDVLVRVQKNSPDHVLQALDAGACGVLAPHVRSAADAMALVRAAHYPPLGSRGFATTTRAGRYGTVQVGAHLERAQSRTIVMPQIEDREALLEVKEIVSVPGIDAILIGPSDLAMSLGHPGNIAHPDVVRAIDDIVKDTSTQVARAIFARTGRDGMLLRKERGIEIVCVASTLAMSSAFRTIREELSS